MREIPNKCFDYFDLRKLCGGGNQVSGLASPSPKSPCDEDHPALVHTDLDRDAAEQFVENKPIGTYVVRLSSTNSNNRNRFIF